jgi:hypothetical protein
MFLLAFHEKFDFSSTNIPILLPFPTIYAIIFDSCDSFFFVGEKVIPLVAPPLLPTP